MGHLGQGVRFCLLKKIPGTPGFVVLRVLFMALHTSPGFYIPLYVQYILIEVAYSSPIPSAAAA